MLRFEKGQKNIKNKYVFFMNIREISLDRGSRLYIFKARSDGEVCLFLEDGNKSRPK